VVALHGAQQRERLLGAALFPHRLEGRVEDNRRQKDVAVAAGGGLRRRVALQRAEDC